MKKVIKILILIFIFSPTVLFSQLYEVEIKEILINNVPIAMSDKHDIVIAREDTIAFKYELSKESLANAASQPFFYNVTLIHDDYKAPRTSGLTEVSYSQLGEGVYTLEVNAFDLGGKWISSTEKIQFRVNNREAALVKKINELNNEKAIADSTILNLEKTINETLTVKYDEFVLIGAGGLAAIFLVLFIILKIKLSRQKNAAEKYKDEVEKHYKKITNLETQVTAEHDDYEKEVKKLRENMDFIAKKFDSILEVNKSVSSEVLSVNSKSDELDNLQSQKNDIFSDIVKGITDPTMVIKGLVDLLRNYDFNANETKDIVENIIDSTKKIIDISEDIQRFIEFKSSDEAPALSLDKTDVNQIVESAVNKNLNAAKNKNIALSFNVQSDITPIRLDAQKITVVLHNLIDNAIKFTDDNGTVSIDCYQKNDSIFFEVKDTGIGINRSDLQKIYQNMEEAPDDSDLETNPTIGLLTVKKYVEAHNGKVKVSSELGKGSTFSFHIPYDS